MTTTTQEPPATAPEAIEQGQGRPRAAWTLVAAREVQVKLTDKNFLIGTGLTVLLLLGVIIVPGLFAGGGDTYRVGAQDQAATQVLDGTAAGMTGEDTVEAVPVDDRPAVESALRAGDLDAALINESGTWQLLVDGEVDPTLQQSITESVRNQVLAQNAQEAGTTVEALTAGSQLELVDVGTSAPDLPPEARFFVGIIFGMVFYMAALMFGMQIAYSVVEEKASRIVEILAAMIPVRQLLMGKVIGNTLLVLGQIVLIAAAGFIGISFTDFDLVLPGLASAIGWYIPFFVLGFLALACIWAAAGSLASRTEDLQTTTMPLTMVLVVIFVAVINLEGRAAQIASFFPIASTMVMPARIVTGETLWWEPVLALVIVAAFCVLTIWIGSRLYQRALLHTTGSLSWLKAFKLGR